MASPLRTAFPTIDEYEKQVASYDAGRPNTAAVQKDNPKFKPAESAGMSMPMPQRPQVATTPAPVSGTDRQLQGLKDAAGSAIAAGARKFMAVSNDFTEGKYLGQNPNIAPTMTRPQVATSTPTTTAQPAQLNPDQQQLAEVRSEIGARNYRMGIDGLKSGEKSIANPLPTPDQVRQTIREKNGLTSNEVPATARPGTVLSSTEATPRKPLPYNGVFADGGPEVKAQDALARRQMEVMQAERGSKNLLYGPSSRDYISPTLSDGEQRARQNEIAEQRIKDVEGVASQQIANQAARMVTDQATGLTSDRNLSMMPYAQRRAVINDRNNLLKLNADDKKRKSDEAVAAANRDAEMARAQMSDSTTRRGQDVGLEADRMKESGATDRTKMTDATTRRGQDVEQQTNLTNAEIAARSKGLDREAMLEAARIRKNAPVDRVKVEGIKAYNKYISDRLTMTPELQNDPAFFDGAMKMFNLSSDDLKAKMMTSANPYDDDEFPTI